MQRCSLLRREKPCGYSRDVLVSFKPEAYNDTQKHAEIPKQYAEIRRNTQAKTPSKNTPSKNTRATLEKGTLNP